MASLHAYLLPSRFSLRRVDPSSFGKHPSGSESMLLCARSNSCSFPRELKGGTLVRLFSVDCPHMRLWVICFCDRNGQLTTKFILSGGKRRTHADCLAFFGWVHTENWTLLFLRHHPGGTVAFGLALGTTFIFDILLSIPCPGFHSTIDLSFDER